MLFLLCLLPIFYFLSVLAAPAHVRDDNGSEASDADVQAYLDGHNSVRAQHGAVNLTWNNTLATAAQTWVDGCGFVHSAGKLGPYGENLAVGTPFSLWNISVLIQYWVEEASQYEPNNPLSSAWTQMVWKATTQVGCAVQICPGDFPGFPPSAFYVCEYFPQGNLIGWFAQNVQP
ncbi:PR-1-like protein [Mycena sanguinolenta]|uniref:PR-1-like protein n=1 Tax=Mycena sanguinolenta TaxID=230812 RepID=A0A8H6XJZ7_9AGAR|nr:PR-1-like protein [Mycena sanguinolenta]